MANRNIMMNASDADENIQEGDTVNVFLYMNRRGELDSDDANADI